MICFFPNVAYVCVPAKVIGDSDTKVFSAETLWGVVFWSIYRAEMGFLDIVICRTWHFEGLKSISLDASHFLSLIRASRT